MIEGSQNDAEVDAGEAGCVVEGHADAADDDST
jgi:hypothetical protein